MPLLETKGAASAQGFGEFAKTGEAVYIESCFSTYLYTGNGSTQTINNGIDLSTKGGLVWVKSRSNVSRPELVDSARGTNSALYTNASDAASSNPSVYNLLSTGFQVGVGSGWGNESGYTYASWTFRKQPKFFDVVTYTGNGSTDRALAHSLNSRPGAIIIKRTDSTGDWNTWCRKDDTNMVGMRLNGTNSASTWAGEVSFTNLGVTTTEFNVGKLWLYDANYPGGGPNVNGATYVAYLFAHNAGGFGLTGTDNVISCGSFTTDGSGSATVNLGYEPQWLLIKSSSEANNWAIVDTMRGLPADGLGRFLFANSSAAESGGGLVNINATGFYANATLSANATYIYIAIRRGPMKTPTSGTSVFSPVYATSASSPYTVTTNFPVDSVISTSASSISSGRNVNDRLRGGTTTSFNTLFTDTTAAESVSSGSSGIGFQSNASVIDNGYWAGYGLNVIYWNFRRAPGFFDVVCYTGDSTNGRSITHNLGVVPEMLIVKKRSSGAAWPTLITSDMRVMEINIDSGYKSAASTKFYYGNGSSDIPPTASAFTVASGGDVNGSGSTYVAYLFASCPGVSKIGSYTGTGALQTINCGFTGGARFVLIKRTDSTGGWFVYDSARGISSGNDPYLLLDVADAEVTGTNYVDTTSVGFQVTAAAPAELNSNGGTYIYLAIA